jgi:hypothetical protein
VIIRNNTDLRRALDEHIKPPVADREWRGLEVQGLVSNFWRRAQAPLGAEVALNDLVAIVRQLRSAWGAGAPAPAARRQKRRTPLDALMQAQAAVIASVVQRDDDVVHFRETYLDGALLPDDAAAEAWVLERARAQTAPAVVYRFEKWHDAAGAEQTRLMGITTPLLLTPWPDASVVACAPHSPLDRLRDLAERLGRAYGIGSRESVRVILTGAPPPLEPIRIRPDCPSVRPSRKSQDIWPGLRLLIIASPFATPAEIVRELRSWRLRAFGGRTRALGPKGLALARFLAEQGQLPWVELMRRWNHRVGRRRPGWGYSRSQNFARDARRALDRLLRPAVDDLERLWYVV